MYGPSNRGTRDAKNTQKVVKTESYCLAAINPAREKDWKVRGLLRFNGLFFVSAFFCVL